jgi:methylenetetrahydrofolate dehydrogenase (NADP+) / methenyltetrahydrofolate cyclohydrolase
MQLFNGKAEAQKLEEEISLKLSSLTEPPKLLVVQIGENEGSEKYINLKVKLCEKLGIGVKYSRIDKAISDDELFSTVWEAFADSDIGGGIIQLPLPRPGLERLLDSIPIQKDIDLLSSEAQKRFYSGDYSRLMPVLRATEHFIRYCGLSPRGLKVTVIGKGFLVGKPVCHYLESLGATVNVIDDHKKNEKIDCQLLVLSAGVPGLVSGANIVNGCHVVDFGSSVVNGKTVGDLDTDPGIDHLGYVSLSPGGMGPLVVRYLIMNLLEI